MSCIRGQEDECDELPQRQGEEWIPDQQVGSCVCMSGYGLGGLGNGGIILSSREGRKVSMPRLVISGARDQQDKDKLYYSSLNV